MAQLPGGSFNAEDHEAMGSFSALPEGSYLAMITSSEMHPTKAGTGEYLEIVFDILTPEYAGRKHTTRLNLRNPSEQAVDIANRELKSICDAVGKVVIQDSVELHGIPLTIEMVVDPAKPAVAETATTKARKARPPSNRIDGYKPASGAAPTGAAKPSNPQAATTQQEAAEPAPGPVAQQEASSGAKPPWA